VLRLVATPIALLGFIFALRLLVLSASGLAGLLDDLDASGPLNLVGLGWLGSYVVLSGSPIAATALTLEDAGVLSEVEAFAEIIGSRLGASLIVLIVGFVSYLRGRRLADGVYVGVVALIVTLTTYIPVGLLGWFALDQGWFGGVSLGAIGPLATFTEDAFDPLLEPLRDGLPDLILFVVGLFVILAALRLFDRVLPSPESTSGRLAQRQSWFGGGLQARWAMFGLGALVTLLTLSVAVSLTLIVPLARQGLIGRRAVIPYVLGANITTLADTLFAASILESGAGGTIVFTVAAFATALALLVLTFLYRPYALAVNGAAAWVSQDRRHLGGFLASIVLLPALLLAL
jgi:hypothetical protein